MIKRIRQDCIRILTITLIVVFNYNFKIIASNFQVKDISIFEDSLKNYYSLLYIEKDDIQKDILNKKILNQFKSILGDQSSFHYSFDSLRNRIGLISSSDNKVRIICWNISYNDGTHKYYGFIQFYKSKKKYYLYELNDKSEKLDKPEFAILDHKNWYGALYYKIITKKYRGKVTYTLLGADLNDLYTKKKIVEVLSFNNNDLPVFGAKIFKNNKLAVSRVIFEFNAQANMILTYDEEREMIINDHLSPSRPSLEGQFEFYGPDFSYDGLKFERGIWNAYFDIDARNDNIE